MFTMTKDILIKEVDIYTLKIPLNKPIKMAGIIILHTPKVHQNSVMFIRV